jgi:hypothetical protein
MAPSGKIDGQLDFASHPSIQGAKYAFVTLGCAGASVAAFAPCVAVPPVRAGFNSLLVADFPALFALSAAGKIGIVFNQSNISQFVHRSRLCG